MSALVNRRASAPTLPMHPHIILDCGERVMEGAFGLVTQSLMRLGTCSLEDLSRSPKADLEGIDLPIVSSDFELYRPSQSTSEPGPMVVADKEPQKVPASMQFVAQLHQICVGAFGNSEALKFEFLEEPGYEDKKRCILTITRPNGQARSYTTEPEFSRKSDAKARAAAIAVDMGAVDFILHGNKDISTSKVILAPLDGSSAAKAEGKVKIKEEESSGLNIVEDEASKQIVSLCDEWRAGRVKPRWLTFKENKSALYWGCVLAVELSPNSRRLYSVEPRYDTVLLAKKACSEAAMSQGVDDFIKYGNGQTAPAPVALDPLNDTMSKREPDIDGRGRTAAISLQSYFESLPKPFPESFEDKPVAHLNVPGILNTTLQLAKGTRLNMQFYFLAENGLHGCAMRLHRPVETRTYMVDCRFMKRSDAKAAVCLQAMSQGVTKYIRSLAATVDNKITAEMRRMANEQILPILGSEYGKLRFGMHPMYDYDYDNGAFGCTMTLSLTANPEQGETKSWSVKPEYRTKTDAKIAVVCAAGGEAIEFVRFKGKPAPPDYDPFKPNRQKGSEQRSMENGSGRHGHQSTPLLETKEEALARQMARGRWVYHDPSSSKQSRYQTTYSHGFSRRAPVPNRHHFQSRKGPSFPPHSYKSPSKFNDTRPYPHPNKTRRDPSSFSSTTPTRLSPAVSECTQVGNQPAPQRPQPQQTTSSEPAPTQPQATAMPEAVPPYTPGAALHQVIPPQAWPIPSPSSAQSPPAVQYQYLTPQGPPYPPPPNAYGYPPPPPPPPTYNIPSYPSYSAYYADPRYSQYPQYAVPGAPMPFAVPVAPPPGMHYSPPQGSVSTASAPVNSTQAAASLPTPPPTSESDKPTSAHWIEIDVSSIRAGSYGADNDIQKRPRSPRDMSMSPDDLQKNRKKLRPTSSSNKADAKRKATSSMTSKSASKDSTAHVQQLLHYCESEGLSSPEFGSKQVKNENGQDAFKVWIVMGKERLELPVTFSSENEGRQRVAKQVLQRLKSTAGKK